MDCIKIAAAVVLFASFACGQESNTATGSLDVNGSTGTGSAPFSVTIEHPQPVIIEVTGTADQPYVLLGATGLSVANNVYSGVGQIDIGSSVTVLVDGLNGPYYPHFANTGSTGSNTIQFPVSQGSVATGSVVQGLQAAVLDPMSAPFGVTLTAATAISFTNNVTMNAQPISDAGTSAFVDTDVCITLDGSASVDPEGSGVTYLWTQTVGTSVTLSDNTAMNPSFIAPSSPETLVFELVVNDGTKDSAASAVYIAVQAATTTQSFATDIMPIFTNNGCVGCHVNGHASGLDLATSAVTAYSGLTSGRVSVCDPTNSLALQKPLGNLGHGGGVIFANTSVPDYLTMLAWITEGALDN